MKKLFVFLMTLLWVTSACSTKGIPTATMESGSTPQESTADDNEPGEPTSKNETVTLTVLYTSDEHGWMAGEEEGQGAAEMAGVWAMEFSESDFILPLSGGDNWTGPAISTWFQGKSMVEAMNAMGYAASAVGNHEFDFSLDLLAERTAEANFPYLGANIHYKANGEIPTDLGIQPFTIVETEGVQIGIIGLANQGTPSVTNPVFVDPLEFSDYETALREFVPQVRQAGADLVLVPGHICDWELSRLAGAVADLEIDVFGSGHCHEPGTYTRRGAVLLGGGSNLRTYSFATFEIDTATGEHELIDYGSQKNQGGEPHPQVAEIVAHWQALTDEELEVNIGYLENEIEQRSDEMAALITESWLWAYPADIAITNWGGMRDRIPAGDITFSDIISVMPFENVLMDVNLTGSELQQVLESGAYLPAVGGAHLESGKWFLTNTGQPLDSQATYSLLVTDFMYAGGDDYTIAEFDPDAYNTAINWRQPVIDWILRQESSPENPLDETVYGLLE